MKEDKGILISLLHIKWKVFEINNSKTIAIHAGYYSKEEKKMIIKREKMNELDTIELFSTNNKKLSHTDSN
jgi:hypothetical protein